MMGHRVWQLERSNSMFIPNNLEEKLEVCDESGRALGFLVNVQAFHDLVAERDALRVRVAELQVQFTEVEAERDELVHAMEVLAREGLVPIGEEEIEDLKRNGVSFEDIMLDLDEILAGKQPEAK
jgi:hypothetical protein